MPRAFKSRGYFFHLLVLPMKLKWWPFLMFSFFIQIQEKGCKKEQEAPQERDYSVYDNYILDMPMDRKSYLAQSIKERKMMEVEVLDLPAEQESIARIDSFDIDGKLLKIRHIKDEFVDSLIYEYTPMGQIEKEHEYPKEKDSTTTQFYYNASGMLSQVIHYRDKVTAYDTDHNKYYKLTDKRISEESPTYSNTREIYKYDSWGRMKEAMVLIDNVPTHKEKRYYDGKSRISKKEFLHQGVVMHSSEYIYNDDDLLSIRKDKIRLDKEKFEWRVYEFTYTYYPKE